MSTPKSSSFGPPSTGASFHLSRRGLLASAAASFAAASLPGFRLAAATVAERRRLGDGWEHYRGSLGGIWEVWRGDKASDNVPWDKVSVPHSYNARDAVDPDTLYYQGPAWYRTRIKYDRKLKNGRLLLHFEGAAQKSDVYVFLEKVGSHVGGYDEFTYDITDAVARAEKHGIPAGEIPIAVLCDNSRDFERIPSSLSDFVVQGGLTRHVNLVEVPAISLGRVLVETDVTPHGKANVHVSARLWNPAKLGDDVQIRVAVFDPAGKPHATTVASLGSTAGEGARVEGATRSLYNATIETPQLWSPDTPALYRCEVTLSSPQGEMQVTERFGLRHFEFKKHGPFHLNGERLLLRGTHRHEDHAGVGAGLTDDLVKKEFEMMKAMGVNFIRLGHYQNSRRALELCDELGILVWEEIPWCRGGLGGPRYQEQAKAMLTAMIDQHRNHPSVIIWGLGNENDWPGDFEKFDKDAIRAFMKELNDLSHKLDSTRKTAIRRCDFCRDIVDVYSPSIWAGWYRGQYTEYKAATEKEMKAVDHFLHVEWGGDSHAGRYAEDADRVLAKIATGQGTDERGLDYLLTGGQARASKDGDWSETYVCNLFDWHLKEQETMPALTGTAQWVFKDFATPLRPENPVPRVNQKGLCERDLTPKDGYYVFQSYWAKAPMVHIAGQGFAIRWGARDEKKLVKVYSNCPEVELFLNGKSLGVRKRSSQDFPAAGLRWMCQFKPGENHLQARATSGDTKVESERRFRYQTEKWGKPAELKLALAKPPGQDQTATVEARVVDGKGVLCLDARNIVRFELAGTGRLIDNLGTVAGSRKVELANGRARISFARGTDPSIITIGSDGVKGAMVVVPGLAPAQTSRR